MTGIPATERMLPRPVWARHLNRWVFGSGNLHPPNEAEIRDAVLVLSDPYLEDEEPELHLEAFRIFDEASR